ncbi:MAG: hypothetical protein Q4F57_07025 [Weeksellaceae bacterium]|nr:hypothetical protein [Weeksellaceae bacterium]
MKKLYFFAAVLCMVAADAQFTGWTPWTCQQDQFIYRRGNQIKRYNASIPINSITPNDTISPRADYNAIGRHPITGVVHAYRIPNDSVAPATMVLNPNGTVVETTSIIPPVNSNPYYNWGGGDITDDGYWILFNQSGFYIIIDLTDTSSPTYGQEVIRGQLQRTPIQVSENETNPALYMVEWLSGDFAWSEKDQRVYFFRYRSFREELNRLHTTIRYSIGWIDREDLFAGGLGVPFTLGAPINNLPRSTYNLGFGASSLAIDRHNNLYVETQATREIFDYRVPYESVFRVNAQYLGQTEGSIPIEGFREIGLTATNQSDGFSCMRPTCQRPAFTRIDAEPTHVGISTLNRGTDSTWVTNSNSSFLKLESPSKGFVPTRMSQDQMEAIGSDAVEGMVVFNTTQDCLMFYNGTEWICGTACTE